MTTTETPPVLPDTSGWVKRAPGDVIEAGTPYIYVSSSGGGFVVRDTGQKGDVHVVTEQTYWTPPPAPRSPVDHVAVPKSKVAEALRAEPMILSSIRRDMERTPGRGGTLRFDPATHGHGASGCSGDVLVAWADLLAALLDGEVSA